MNKAEIHRINYGAGKRDRNVENLLVNFNAVCPGNSIEVLNYCKEILKLIILSSESQPSLEDWNNILPKWFIGRCAEEMTDAEAEESLKQWRLMSWEEKKKAELEERWSLSEGIYWFRPEMRHWFWWDSEIIDSNNFKITVEVDGLPFPSGSLKWLAIACGAVSFEEE